MFEIHCCMSCKSRMMLEIGKGEDCLSCGNKNFMLYRGGNIGTAIAFENAGVNDDDFEWLPGHKEMLGEVRSKPKGVRGIPAPAELRRMLGMDENEGF